MDAGELNKQKDSLALDPQGRPLVYLIRLRRTGLVGPVVGAPLFRGDEVGSGGEPLTWASIGMRALQYGCGSAWWRWVKS